MTEKKEEEINNKKERKEEQRNTEKETNSKRERKEEQRNTEEQTISKRERKKNKESQKRKQTVKVIAADNGGCVAEFTVQEEHTNPMGTLHGGFSATLIDNVSSYGLRGLLGNKVHVSVAMNISYIKGAKIGDEVVVDSQMLKVGKTLAFMLVTLKNKQTGELLVKGSHTKFILDKEVS
ncbi:thioesterase superfamily member-related [Holotrichia oblita]|uniref:Thioesterase superfamily member-related n=2 Tax=Holotrichia oblita TaxID=644536 RepID=A0ACB9THA3_HOLOL|nr:thioesterase superfamily member-related [Holotrichia oblita]KAI4466167.1 thioesterase superfamily member-related [Holotrichia oblita]